MTENKPTRAPAKKKQPAATETSESIAERTRIFLASGNKIESIPSGISGQPTGPSKKPVAHATATTVPETTANPEEQVPETTEEQVKETAEQKSS
ncbi:MAG: hypothetical protein ACJAVI_004282 [Candidatus Azotimanducaceae bacterium]|jgi:hypothetical protein